MEEEGILGLVSMLRSAPLNQKKKTFQALIYYHFIHPSSLLTSSSKIFEVCGHIVHGSHATHAFISRYSISMC